MSFLVGLVRDPLLLIALACAVVYSLLIGNWILNEIGRVLKIGYVVLVTGSTGWVLLAPRTDGAMLLPVGDVLWRRAIVTTEIILLALAALAIFWALLARSRVIQLPLIMSLLVLAGASVFSALVAPTPALPRGAVVLPVIMLGLLAAGQRSRRLPVSLFASSLGVIMWASLAVAVIAPQWAFYGSTSTAIAAFHARLAGLTSHPNALGGLAALALAITIWPGISSRHRMLVVPPALGALYLSESKTAWVSAITAALIWWIFRSLNGRRAPFKSATLVVIVGVALTFSVLMMETGAAAMDSGTSENLTTLTGRTAVWAVSIDLWRNRPILGYGQEAWSEDWREQYDLAFAGQAHNQFIQALVQTGLLGLLATFIYLGVLAAAAIRAATATNGATLAVYMVLLLRCMTESPLKFSIADHTFLIHVSVFLLISLTQRPIAPRPPPKLMGRVRRTGEPLKQPLWSAGFILIKDWSRRCRVYGIILVNGLRPSAPWTATIARQAHPCDK